MDRTVADELLIGLHDCGITHVFANSGTDFAPIIESLARLKSLGIRAPRFITVPHENVAVAMANGFASVSGRAGAAMVHVNVGTANSLCGMMTASRDNVPILLMAGRTPLTEAGDNGSRDNFVQWPQESFDQAAIVREQVKWDYELRGGQDPQALVARALSIAQSAPAGPVYVTLPREVLAAAAAPVQPAQRKVVEVAAVAPVTSAIEAAAAVITAAKAPLIIAGRIGRTAEGFAALSAFAEEFAIPVVQVGAPNLPFSHPMNLGGATPDLLGVADTILVLDAPVPWIPRFMRPHGDAKVIHVGSDPLFARYPVRTYPADLAIAGDGAATLTMLGAALRGAMKTMEAGIEARRRSIAEARATREKRASEFLAKVKDLSPIHPSWLGHALNQAKPKDAIIVNEIGVAAESLDVAQAGCFLTGGSGGLGLALGQALGAKLADPGRDVITVLGDGSYMLGVPLAAHFVAQAEQLPTLTIIVNNAMWYAVRRATLELYPDGHAAKANDLPLIGLNPSPAFEKVIESCGGRGERIDKPEDLIPAIQRGLADVRQGTPVLLNVICRPRGP